MILWYLISVVGAGYITYLGFSGIYSAQALEGGSPFEFPYWFFPSDGLLTVLLTMAVVYGYGQIARVGAKAYASTISGRRAGFAGGVTYFLLFFFILYGLSIVLNPPFAEFLEAPMGEDTGFLGFLVGMVIIVVVGLSVLLPSVIALMFFTFFALPLFSFLFLASLPFFGIGLYSFGAGDTEASGIAKKHAQTRRPNDEIEKELAEALQSGLRSDSELQKIIDEMSSFARFFHTLTFKRKAQKYREMRELMEAMKKTREEQEAMGRTAHEYERTKRRYE